MKPAQTKKPLILAGVVTLAAAVAVISPQVFAQGASNPFVPTPTTEEFAPPLLLEQAEALNEVDVNQTTQDGSVVEANTVALTAIPPRLGDDGSLTGAPGEVLQVQLRVRNLTEQSIPVVTSIQDFILDPDGETPVGINDDVSNRWSLANWVTLTPSEHRIASKETVGINAVIQIPEDALPGGHYAMVLHEPGVGATDALGSSSAVNQRVGTLLYVIVEGPINEEAYVRDFQFPKFSEYGPVPFQFTVENNSDIHITPQMSVEIYNILNQKVETITVEPKNIFPLYSRDFSGAWDRVWGLGLYKAKLTMSYGTQGSIVVANTSFWLLPIKIILAAITAIITLLLIVLSVKRHLRHKAEEDEKRIQELEAQLQSMQSQGEEETQS